MKKVFILVVFSSIAMLSSMSSVAGPHAEREDDSRDHKWQERSAERPHDENRMRERRMRQERGVERLKQHRWQAGYVMPQHYRGNSYKIDYKDSNLPKPNRNEQWYKINNDYILVNSEDNSILRIMNF